MKNTMSTTPTTATATTALALSLLQAPTMCEAQAADGITPPTTTSLSQVENALVRGSTTDALRIIDSSAMKDVRIELVEKNLPMVVERVVRDLVQQGHIKDAQRVVRTIQEFAPEAAKRGALMAFSTLDKESFEKFSDESVWRGPPTYRGLRQGLNSTEHSNALPSSKTAELIDVLDKAESARNKKYVGLEAGAICAAGIAKATGSASHRTFLHRGIQTIGGLAAFAGGSAVFASLLNHTAGIVSWESALLAAALWINVLALEQVKKGLVSSSRD